MSVIRLTVSDLYDFYIFEIAEAMKTASPETRKYFEKIFRSAALKKFNLENKTRFLQRHRIFQNSLENNQNSRIEIVPEKDGKIEPDKKRPAISQKLLDIIRKLTGTSNESLQEDFFREMMVEIETAEKNETLSEKYLDNADYADKFIL